jgi:hypothetical protein
MKYKTKGYAWMRTGIVHFQLRPWEVDKLKAAYERVTGRSVPPLYELITQWIHDYATNVEEERAWVRLRKALGRHALRDGASKADLLHEAAQRIERGDG